MSNLQLASEVMADAQQLAAKASEELSAAYRALFDGTPTRDDQLMVLRDLEKFCGMRTAMLRPTFHETAEAVGKFRVWQRIHALRDPLERRPPDARAEGERHGHQDERPIASGGVAEPTDD